MLRNAAEYHPHLMAGEKNAVQQEERFLIRDQEVPRTLLPGELPAASEGTVVAFMPGVCINSVAGAGGIALENGWQLGGWCSFCGQLMVPRRFAAREGVHIAKGAKIERVLCDRMREELHRLLTAAGQELPMDAAKTKRQLIPQLRSAAEQEMMELGWHLTHCRLEAIQITRSE